jgi:hypothetical protein
VDVVAGRRGRPVGDELQERLVLRGRVPTPFGSAMVSALQTYDPGGRDLCDVAADFASAVASDVSD